MCVRIRPAGLVFGAGTPVTNSHIGALIPQMLGQPLANLFELDGSGLGQVMHCLLHTCLCWDMCSLPAQGWEVN